MLLLHVHHLLHRLLNLILLLMMMLLNMMSRRDLSLSLRWRGCIQDVAELALVSDVIHDRFMQLSEGALCCLVTCLIIKVAHESITLETMGFLKCKMKIFKG